MLSDYPDIGSRLTFQEKGVLVRGPDGLRRLVDFMDERSIRVRDLNREYFRKRDEDSTHRQSDEH